MNSTPSQEIYQYREITRAEELIELFRLRYEVYRSSRLKGFVPENDGCMDVDVFDRHARHFGYYRIDNGQSELIGGIRIVENSRDFVSTVFIEAAALDRAVEPICFESRPADLPLLTYAATSKQIQAYLEREYGGQRVVEPSRLCLKPVRRTWRHSRNIVCSAIASCALGPNPADAFIMSCASTQRRFYKQYGFRPVFSEDERAWSVWNQPLVCLIASPSDVPTTVQVELGRIVEEFKANGTCSFKYSADSGRPLNLAIAL